MHTAAPKYSNLHISYELAQAAFPIDNFSGKMI